MFIVWTCEKCVKYLLCYEFLILTTNGWTKPLQVSSIAKQFKVGLVHFGNEQIIIQLFFDNLREIYKLMHLDHLRKIYWPKWKKPCNSKHDHAVRYLGHIVPENKIWHFSGTGNTERPKLERPNGFCRSISTHIVSTSSKLVNNKLKRLGMFLLFRFCGGF